MGSLAEAVSCFDEAICVYRHLVEKDDRTELASYLAMAQNNKGLTLKDMGSLSDAIACYGEAIVIYRRLVEKENRTELVGDLAGALMNKENALRAMGFMVGANACCADTIDIFRRIVEENGLSELADYLAMALINKANALNNMGFIATACYDEAIALLENMAESDMIHIIPQLLMVLRIRFLLKSQDSAWQAAAKDVIRVINYALPVLQSDSRSEMVEREFWQFIQVLSNLSENNQTALYMELGVIGLIQNLN